MKKKTYRHGEISFIKINTLPTNLKEEKTKIIMKGSHGNSHSFDNGKLFLKNVSIFVFGYFVAKNTTLFHPKHGNGDKISDKIKKAKLPNGVYELRKQQEYINQEIKPIID